MSLNPFYEVGTRRWLAIGKQANPTTAVAATNYGYFDTSSIVAGFESGVLAPANNTRSKNSIMVPGKNGAPTGTIVMQEQPNILVHFLAGTFGAPVATGPTDTAAYTYTYQSGPSGTIPSYTLNLGSGDSRFTRRYVGSRFGGFKRRADSGKNIWIDEFTVMARYEFIRAKITSTVSSGHTIPVDDNHGLVIGDKVFASFCDSTNEEELTVSAVATDGLSVTVTETIAKTHTTGDILVIKSLTPSYSTATPFMQWLGGTTISIGTTLGGATSQQRLEEFSLDFSQELVAKYAPAGTSDYSRWPSAILVKDYGATMSTKFYHQDLTYLGYMKDRQDLAFSLVTTGNLIAGAATTKESVTMNIAAARLDPYDVPSNGDAESEESITAKLAESTADGFDVQMVVVTGVSSV